MTIPSDSGTNAGIAGTGKASGSGDEDEGLGVVSRGGYDFQKYPALDILGQPIPGQFTYEKLGKTSDGASGSGRNDALSAAQSALSGFLQAQSLADARKMAAMENFQKLSKFALPAGAKYAPGYEPGGAANTLAARQGLKSYTPPSITPRQVNPGDVAGEIPPEIRAMIGSIRAAGGG